MSNTIQIKRKRGRPRRDEPREINDFDLSLIQHFQRFPAFYDRQHPQYRNREFSDPQWVEIAGQLGYNVGLIKERMLQLRNRYNLEKRRVEALQEQEKDPDITSQWALYESLSFLSDHIKTRRPYPPKTLMSLRPKKSPETDSSDADDFEDTQQFVNGNTSAQAQSLMHSSSNASAAMATVAAANHRQSSHHNEPKYTCANAASATRASIPAAATIGDKTNQQNHLQFSFGSCGIDKFNAFGQFLASSLIEMNEIDALRLVEKFTAELVKSLLAEQRVSAVNGQINQQRSYNSDILNTNA